MSHHFNMEALRRKHQQQQQHQHQQQQQQQHITPFVCDGGGTAGLPRDHKRDVVCINCGFTGHTSKNCNFPITSFGVIAYKIIRGKVYYLMVQRKDSLCYTEFIRGKYDIKNIKYIAKLVDNMTEPEKVRLSTWTFDKLWNNLWINNMNNMRKEYNTSAQKFKMLKNGFLLKSNCVVLKIDINHYTRSESRLAETEWEFPKGRRKINERDINCALREFEEESGISRNAIVVDDGQKQYEEIFVGNNRLRYRNIYYMASYTLDNIYDDFFKTTNMDQVKEIKDVKWLDFENVCKKINQKVEKLELFKRIHYQIMKTKNVQLE